MPNMMAAYRLAVAAGVDLPPAREAPPVPQRFIDQVVAREATRMGWLRSVIRRFKATGGIIMYDSTEPSAFPSGAALVASYVDGYGGYAAAVSRFGAAKCVSISVGNTNADFADVEPGAMTTGELSGWISRQKARGISRPGLYSDGSQYNSVRAAGGSSCSYWTANPTGQVVQTLPGRDAVQSVFGSAYDESWVLSSFPWYPGGVTPPPPPTNPWPLSNGSTGANVVTLQRGLNKWKYASPLLVTDGNFGALTEDAVKTAQAARKLPVTGVVDETLWKILLVNPVPPPPPAKFYGKPRNLSADAVPAQTVNYDLAWSAPSPQLGVPVPTQYQVFVYENVADEAHIVEGYPAKIPAMRTTVVGLKHGQHYIVHVVAAGNTEYIGKDVFATLTLSP